MKRIFYLVLRKRFIIVCLVTIGFIPPLFLLNPISNLHFFLKNDSKLQIKASSQAQILFENDYIRITRVNLIRKHNALIQKAIHRISKPRMYHIAFKQDHGNFYISLHKQGETAHDRIKEHTVFAVNSSFFDSDNNAVGEIYINGVQNGERTRSSGFFKVINGKAYAGPTSLFKTIKGTPEFSCQAHPSLMKNGIIWDYIVRESLPHPFWKQKTYRNLSGMDKNGNIHFLVSGSGGLLSVKETAQLALTLGIKTATLFDAGSSLQYKFSTDEFELAFSAYNNILNLGPLVDYAFFRLTGNTFLNKAPVFINYKDP